MFYNTMCRYLFVVGLLCLSATTALAAPSFPELTGRVVDNAGLLSSSQRQTITRQLAAHEDNTSNQIVIVTLKSLQGYDIADYGVRLGRHWGIGQAEKNNGVLLIVAPRQRKLRIEVGYGLEARLTDALSKHIIDNEIVPHFKKKNYAEGIQAGVNAIVAVLGGTYTATRDKKRTSRQSILPDEIFVLAIVVLFLGNILARIIGLKKSTIIVFLTGFSIGGGYTDSWLTALYIAIATAFFHMLMYFLGEGGHGGGGSGGYGGSSGSGGSFGGGSFGGGGGSFGGGGASGGW